MGSTFSRSRSRNRRERRHSSSSNPGLASIPSRSNSLPSPHILSSASYHHHSPAPPPPPHTINTSPSDSDSPSLELHINLFIFEHPLHDTQPSANQADVMETNEYASNVEDVSTNDESPFTLVDEQDLPRSIRMLLSAITNHLAFGDGSPFEDFLDQMFQQYQPHGPPPTSQNVLENLKETVVTNPVVCVICKEEMVTGSKGLKLPCQHFYHMECIKPWLNQHNTCPQCRYELPTDDIAYEADRKQRMAPRNISEKELNDSLNISCRKFANNGTQ